MGVLQDFKEFDLLQKNPVSIRYGIDYLRFNFMKSVPYLDRILNKLDYDNSNFAYDEDNDFNYTKFKLSTGPALMISCSYDNKSVPIWMYNIFENWIKKSVYSRLDFYGSYFRLEELGFFPLGWYNSFIDDLTSEIPSITRIDYCVDLFYNSDEILFKPKQVAPNCLSSEIKYRVDTISKWKETQSWSIGSKSSKRNVLRMYDKLADLDSKQKFFLYQDYLEYKSVHRIEFQFGPNFTRWFFLDNLDILIQKITDKFNVSKVAFNGPMFYKYSSNHEINDYSRLFYTKQFTGRAEKFFYSNINPYRLLLQYFDSNLLKLSDIQQHKKFLLEFYLDLSKHELLSNALNLSTK